MIPHKAPDTVVTFDEDGAQHFVGVAKAALPEILAALADLPLDQAGVRITGRATLRPFLAPAGPIGKVAADILGPDCRAVRAILFDKTAGTNWSLAWHQDRTISVLDRREVEGFGPWTIKGGLQHVAPPFEILANMVTARIHLDDVPIDNAPLLIAPGSHRAGQVPIGQIDEIVRRCGTYTCLARAGDIWIYATPILHASAAASSPNRRRVLQVDFAAQELSGGLRWSGV